MNTRLQHTAKRCITSLLVSFICIGTTMAVGNNKLRYSTDSPLRLVCEPDFYPFEYRDDAGNADGFNIKVATKILGTLNIPYNITMTIRTEASKVFDSNNADLIITAPTHRIPGVYYSKNILAPYKVMIAYTKGKTPIKSLKDLKHNDIILFKEGNYSTEIVKKEKLIRSEQMMYRTVKQGLLGIATGDYQYVICGEATMKTVMRKFGISNIEFADIDIPEGAIRFCSRDKMLINLLDEELEKMKSNGQLSRIYQQSLTVDVKSSKYIPYAIFGIFGILVLFVILILVNRYVTKRIKLGMQSTIETNNIMKKALETININMLETDIKRRWVNCLYGKDIPYGGISVDDTIKRIHPDDIETISENYHKMLNKQEGGMEYFYRYNIGTEQTPNWRLFYANALPEYDKNGNVMSQFTAVTDITEESSQDKVNEETSEIYKQIFDMPLVGFALYDKNGRFIEANHVMKEIFKSNNPRVDLFSETYIYDFPAFAGVIDSTLKDNLFFCTYSDATNDNIPNYVEIKIRPIMDEKGDIIYHMITARDKSDERHIYRQSRLNDEKVRLVSDKMMQYENELRYLLKGSQMKVWKSNIKSETIRLFLDLHTFETKYTFEEFLANVEDDKKADAIKLIDPRENHGKAYSDTLLINDKQSGNKIWCTVNSIPEYDDKGNIIGCFGLIHNVNTLVEAQIKMKKEKERAKDSSRQKSTFLANMSHEIRTPLNAIVGFCDIMQSIGSPEEKTEIMKIIHNNCNNLLQIISDILVLSELDSNGLTLNPEECDFAKEFNLLCKSLSQRVSEPSVKFITDNPYTNLITTIDKGRISQVITNFLTNAVKYTQEGHIKLGYHIKDNGIHIYCEDTGKGIPKDKCERIFERFIKLNDYVQGAGIGLSICKAIATKCEGEIGVNSEEGKGSTFWIWIPCEIRQFNIL